MQRWSAASWSARWPCSSNDCARRKWAQDETVPHVILIVDDSATIRGFARLVLRPLGVTILEADDGGPALQILQGQPVDLVIADVNMPGMSGLELTAALRRDPSATLRALPVILLTGDRSPGMRDEALQAGAQELVEKPIKQAELQAAVKLYLGGRA